MPYHPVRAQAPVLKPLTPKFKGGQAPLLAVEGTVDRQRILASTQGLPLIREFVFVRLRERGARPKPSAS